MEEESVQLQWSGAQGRQLLYFPSRAVSGMQSGSDLVAFSDFLGSAQLLVILRLRSLPGFTAGQTIQFSYYKLHESHQQGVSLFRAWQSHSITIKIGKSKVQDDGHSDSGSTGIACDTCLQIRCKHPYWDEKKKVRLFSLVIRSHFIWNLWRWPPILFNSDPLFNRWMLM